MSEVSSSVKSAERVMNVLKFLSGRVRPVPSMTISQHLGLPKSSTYHLLNAMKEQNFVTYYPDEHAWGLGPSAFEIGTAYLRGEPLAWLGRPLLKELAESTGVTSHLAVLYGQDVLYLVKESPGTGPQLVSGVGLRLPAHLTAVGRAILMRLPKDQLRALYPARDPLVRRTQRGPTLVTELERSLESDAARGYTIDDGMTTPGITCIAATVFSHEGLALAGLGLTFPTDQIGLAPREQLAAQTLRSASQLSNMLGWRPEVGATTAEQTDEHGARTRATSEPRTSRRRASVASDGS
jgi:DNA-binding IclR family transcriptional regulator